MAERPLTKRKPATRRRARDWLNLVKSVTGNVAGRAVGSVAMHGVAAEARAADAARKVAEAYSSGKPYKEIVDVAKSAIGRDNDAALQVLRRPLEAQRKVAEMAPSYRNVVKDYAAARKALAAGGPAEEAAYSAARDVYEGSRDAYREIVRESRKVPSSSAAQRLVRKSAGPKTLAEKVGTKFVAAGRSAKGSIVNGLSHLNPFQPGVVRSAIARNTHWGVNPKTWVPSLVRTPQRVGAWALNGVQNMGAGVAGKLAANNAGKLALRLGRLAKSPFTPAGLAASAWIDAGLNAWDFFASGGLGDAKALLNDKDAHINWSEFLQDYGVEALKGVGRLLTLGLTLRAGDRKELSSGERKAIDLADPGDVDRVAGVDASTNAADARFAETAGKGALEQRRAVLANAAALSQRAQMRANFDRAKVDVDSFRTYLKGLRDDRDARLAGFARTRDAWGDGSDNDKSQTLQRWHSSADEYYAAASARENAQYEKAMDVALSNKAVAQLLEANKKDAYRQYYGGDYDRDSASGSDSVGQFDQVWRTFDDRDKATWLPADFTPAKAGASATQGAVGAGRAV